MKIIFLCHIDTGMKLFLASSNSEWFSVTNQLLVCEKLLLICILYT